MLVTDKDAVARLNSSDNLINKIRTLSTKKPSSMGLFGLNQGSPVVHQVRTHNPEPESTTAIVPTRVSFDPFKKNTVTVLPPAAQPSTTITVSTGSLNQEQPKVDDLIDSVDVKIKLTQTHNKALEVLGKAVEMIGLKLDDIKPDKLPSVIAAASKTVESIRKEQIELGKTRKEKNVHFHFYEPERRQLSDYQVLDV